MTKLRYIKPHGPNKVGDIQVTESATTVRWLVKVYKVAVIEPDNPIATAEPVAPVADVTAQKFLRYAPKDKMTHSGSNKGARRY